MKISLIFKNFFVIGAIFVALSPGFAQTDGELLTLDAANERLIENNLSLEAARLEVSAARQARVYAQLRPRPTLSVSAENLRVAGVTPFNRLYEFGAVVTQPIPLGGQTRAKTEIADRSISLAEARLEEVLRLRLFEMRRTFFEVLLAQTQLTINQENSRNFDELLRYNETRLKEGDVSPGEVLKLRLERIKYDTAVATARLNLRQAKIKLFELLGETDFLRVEKFTLVETLDFKQFDLDLASLKKAASENRPEIKIAEAELSRLESVLTLETARAKGEIEPYVGYRRVGIDNTVLVGVNIPLPFGNRNQVAIARAEADRKMAASAVQRVKNRTSAEVESVFLAFETSREQLKAYESGFLEQADDSLRISVLSYREGATDILNVFEAQRTRTDLRGNYYQTLLTYYTNLFQLELLTGTDLKK